MKDKLVEEFLGFLEVERNASPRTLRIYRDALRDFRAQTNAPGWRQCRAQHFRDYLFRSSASSKSSATLRRAPCGSIATHCAIFVRKPTHPAGASAGRSTFAITSSDLRLPRSRAQRFAAHPADLSRRIARFSCANQRTRLAPVQGAALSRLPLPICGFLEVERNASPRTLRIYRDALRDFRAQTNAPGWRQCRAQHFRDYLFDLMKRKQARSYIRRQCPALRSFYRFLVARNRLTRDPVRQIQLPKAEKKLPLVLTQRQIGELL